MSSNANSLIIYGYIISLFCDSLSSIIVSSTQINSYNPFVIVFWCLFSKFLICLAIHYHQNYDPNKNNFKTLWQNCVQNSSTFLLYSVPSFLYLLADILWYFNLANINPVAYSMLWQLRIVCTALIHQRLFARILSRIQWISLMLLTVGCLLKQLDTTTARNTDGTERHIELTSYLLVFAQILCSCFAGVYNEYLLKGTPHDSKADPKKPLDLMIQNMFMYSNSMIFNLVIISIVSDTSEIPRFMSHVIFDEPKMAFVLLNTTFLGIMTSLFLKNLDSVFRTFGAVFQIIFTAILSFFLLNLAINLVTVLSIGIVISALFIYVKNPVEVRVIEKSGDSLNEKLLIINEAMDENV